MAKQEHKIAASIRAYATKLAADKAAAGGAPDRMTSADGQGGITTEKPSVPHDSGEDLLKREQPTDGKNRPAAAVGVGPDRMTTADGQGGISTSPGTVPKDPGEAELKADQPADGISKKAARIRAALCKTNPTFAAQLGKEAGTPAPSAAPAAAPAAPENHSIDLSRDTLAKIASAILSTDAGVRFVHDTLEKQAGEQAARVQIQEAIMASQVFDQTEQVKSAAFDDLGYKVAEIHGALVESGITEQDAEAIIKQASVHQLKMASYEHPLLKQAYAQGMDDAALLAAAEDAGGAEGAPPVEEAMPMGGEDLSEEEIVALLQEMIASGEITEEEIAEAIAATQGGGAEGGGAEAAAAPAPEAMPA
jgi:hypothetical protein